MEDVERCVRGEPLRHAKWDDFFPTDWSVLGDTRAISTHSRFFPGACSDRLDTAHRPYQTDSTDWLVRKRSCGLCVEPISTAPQSFLIFASFLFFVCAGKRKNSLVGRNLCACRVCRGRVADDDARWSRGTIPGSTHFFLCIHFYLFFSLHHSYIEILSVIFFDIFFWHLASFSINIDPTIQPFSLSSPRHYLLLSSFHTMAAVL